MSTEAPTIRVGRRWQHKEEAGYLVRVERVVAQPSYTTGEPDRQDVYYVWDDGKQWAAKMLDYEFLAAFSPFSEPGNEHESDSLKEALDLIEEVEWEGDTGQLSGETDPGCPWCAAPESDSVIGRWKAHKPECRAALLLRKHGRKVCFRGEPA